MFYRLKWCSICWRWESQHHWPAPPPEESCETPAAKPLKRHSETQTHRQHQSKHSPLTNPLLYADYSLYSHVNTFPERRKHLTDAMFHCPLSGGGAVMPEAAANQRARCKSRTGNAGKAANHSGGFMTEAEVVVSLSLRVQGQEKNLFIEIRNQWFVNQLLHCLL